MYCMVCRCVACGRLLFFFSRSVRSSLLCSYVIFNFIFLFHLSQRPLSRCAFVCFVLCILFCPLCSPFDRVGVQFNIFFSLFSTVYAFKEVAALFNYIVGGALGRNKIAKHTLPINAVTRFMFSGTHRFY